jgi:hypothetical protein
VSDSLLEGLSFGFDGSNVSLVGAVLAGAAALDAGDELG